MEKKFSDLLSDRYKDLLKKDERVQVAKQTPAVSCVSSLPEEARPWALEKHSHQSPSASSSDDAAPEPLHTADVPGISHDATETGLSGQVAAIPASMQGALNLEEKLTRFIRRVSEGETYPSNQELQTDFGFTGKDFATLSEYKYKLMLEPDAGIYERIGLTGEGGKNLFYRKTYAAAAFTDIFNTYTEKRDHFKVDLFIDDMLFNLIFSETQSAFDLESNLPSHRVIESILTKKNPVGPAEQLLFNIYESYAFILENDITEEGLFSLRKILTKNLEVKPSRRYRTEDLSVPDGLGGTALQAVSAGNIDLAMRKLFSYIDFTLSNADPVSASISSLIIHYYFIYISPYFEYNFTLARFLSTWYVIRHPDIVYKPLFLSEAINRDKHTGKYIKALKDSFDSGGDLTYFINYLADVISVYSLMYMKLSKIIDSSLSMSINLSRSEERAVKVILLFPSIGEGYFDWQKFKAYDRTNFSKQYYNRLLNRLEQKGVLTTSRSQSVKLYRLNLGRFQL